VTIRLMFWFARSIASTSSRKAAEARFRLE